MRKLTAFNFITLNGFFKGTEEDISWHRHGEDESKYSEEMLALNNILLFGRKTYENMSGFWPSPASLQLFPKVAQGMNNAEKIVFSNTIKNASWQNTTVLGDDIIQKVKELKKTSGKDLTILGSGSIVTLFVEHMLIDELQIMVDPVVINEGVSFLHGLKGKIDFKLNSSKIFKSGVVLLNYEML